MHETLDELLHRQPFKPFVIFLSNGNSYTVKHPEFVRLLKAKIIIGFPDTEEIVICFLLHVSDVKTLGRV